MDMASKKGTSARQQPARICSIKSRRISLLVDESAQRPTREDDTDMATPSTPSRSAVGLGPESGPVAVATSPRGLEMESVEPVGPPLLPKIWNSSVARGKTRRSGQDDDLRMEACGRL